MGIPTICDGHTQGVKHRDAGHRQRARFRREACRPAKASVSRRLQFFARRPLPECGRCRQMSNSRRKFKRNPQFFKGSLFAFLIFLGLAYAGRRCAGARETAHIFLSIHRVGHS
ncbi:hypothetical protein [Pandoraea fibrosis]|uniref:hypothetical protein n=1 Tax=Pandoraea fibrosis TaxID=1891094 RepID=UPI0038B3F340